MNIILMIGALVLGVLLAKGFERGLDYWSRRLSVGTLYLQWSDDR